MAQPILKRYDAMILCIKCDKYQPESEYYRSTMRANGTGECKSCTRARVRANREAKIDYYREFDRKRANLPHRVQARKEYAQTEAGKERKSAAIKAWAVRNPASCKAHNAVNNAVRDGRLIKPDTCESCNNKCNPHGHHCDYNKPLDVMWLCVSCHNEWHKENTPIYHADDVEN